MNYKLVFAYVVLLPASRPVFVGLFPAFWCALHSVFLYRCFLFKSSLNIEPTLSIKQFRIQYLSQSHTVFYLGGMKD